VEREVDRAREVARRAVDGQVRHELARLVAVVRGGGAVEVGGERDEALGREPVGDVLDVAREVPLLLDDDHALPGSGLRNGQVAVCGAAV
jgi:hypothetical protein